MALKLLDWQERGVDFLLDKPKELDGNPHRYLNDEMGLGKTPQVCEAVKRLRPKMPVLYIVLASLKDHWKTVLVEWGVCKPEDIFVIETGKDLVPSSAKHIICSYDILASDNIFNQLMAMTFPIVVCDEAHALRSTDSNRSRNILGKTGKGLISRGYYKWLVSGTAAPDRIIDLFPTLKVLAPQTIRPYTSLEGYGERFCAGYFDKRTGQMNYKGASNVAELRQRLKPFLLRRTIDEVYPELPPYVQEDIFIDLGVLDFDEHDTPTATLRRLIGQAKVPKVVAYIIERLQLCDRLLVFAYHREVILGLFERLRAQGIAVHFLRGDTPKHDRQRYKNDFIAGRIDVLIIQTGAGATGTDGLQQNCSQIVEAEPDWSPGLTSQARARLRRIKQTKVVSVKSLLALNTLDMGMRRTHDKKQNVLTELFTTEKHNQMSIEATLERIAVALETLAKDHEAAETPAKEKSGKGSAGAKDAKAAAGTTQKPAADTEKPASKEAKVTQDDASKVVREVLAELSKTKLGKEGAKQAVKDVVANIGGADLLANVAADKLGAVVDGFRALLANPPSEDDSDGI